MPALDVDQLLGADDYATLSVGPLSGSTQTYPYSGLSEAGAAAIILANLADVKTPIDVNVDGSDDGGATWSELATATGVISTHTLLVDAPPDMIRVTLTGEADSLEVRLRPFRSGAGGGTLTEPVQVETGDPTDVQLLLQGAAGSTNNVFEAYPDADDQSHFWVDYHACLFMYNDDEFEESKVEVQDNVGGFGHFGSLSSWDGLRLHPQPTSHAIVFVTPSAGHTGPLVRVLDPGGNPAFQVDADGSVHIKTGTAIVADL